MEIIIKGTPKEIAELALELQGRQKKNIQSDDVIQKQIELVSKASEDCCNTICNNYDNYNTLASLTNSLLGLCNLRNDFQKHEEVDFSAAQKAITAAAKKVHEEKSTPKYETREIHIFCGNASDSSSQNQQVKERTVGDVKKIFEKTLRDLGLSKD